MHPKCYGRKIKNLSLGPGPGDIKEGGRNREGYRKSEAQVGNGQMYDQKAMDEALRRCMKLGYATIPEFMIFSGRPPESVKMPPFSLLHAVSFPVSPYLFPCSYVCPRLRNPFSCIFFRFFYPRLEYISYICTVNINIRTMSTQVMTQQIAEYFKTQPVLKAWLFGSFARGEEREDSDVDVLVKFDRSIPIGLFAYVRMHRELEEKLGRKVDLVEEGTLRPAAQQTANRDLKVIYERNY